MIQKNHFETDNTLIEGWNYHYASSTEEKHFSVFTRNSEANAFEFPEGKLVDY